MEILFGLVMAIVLFSVLLGVVRTPVGMRRAEVPIRVDRRR